MVVHGYKLWVLNLSCRNCIHFSTVLNDLPLLLLKLWKWSWNDRQILGADAVEFIEYPLDLRLLDAEYEGVDEFEWGVFGAVEHYRHAADHLREFLDGFSLARSRVTLECRTLVQLERHGDVEPRTFSCGRDNEFGPDAVLLPALLEVLLLVDHAHADFIRAFVVLSEFENAIPLPRVLGNDVEFWQILQPN